MVALNSKSEILYIIFPAKPFNFRASIGRSTMSSGKSIDETQAPELAKLAEHQEATAGSPVPVDSRRRRLIRGAAGLAPVVLTVRSGTLLAASSCAAVVQPYQPLGDKGAIPMIANVSENDSCIGETATICPNGRLSGDMSTIVGTVQPNPDNLNALTCFDDKNQPLPAGTNIAVVSAMSISSFLS